MSDFVTYPLDQTCVSGFTADMWNFPLPLDQIIAMFSSSGSTPPQVGRQQIPSWRPARTFPPQRYIAAAVQVVFHGISRLPMVAYVLPLVPPNIVYFVTTLPLSRVTLTDYRGFVIYDTYVRPTLKKHALL
ncbi:hypothetical protein PHLCEN_2v12780 [Hermanssonia centrifuga]|uniref:Uncharacterized protein n=1 Tax=Hermanssonia centrifuga TaxID=98765 RepID=A0A2R6NFX1_9APHY|nr:hypothetical protein PHLCEN_2v12780 [Hermanssonia centrifuga]